MLLGVTLWIIIMNIINVLIIIAILAFLNNSLVYLTIINKIKSGIKMNVSEILL